jgi:tRNA(Ile)-lysidine synthase
MGSEELFPIPQFRIPNSEFRIPSFVLLQRIRRFIRQHDLIAPGSRILAAVSGGSDSMALLHALHELNRTGELRLVGVVHFNHQLRPAADADERFVMRAAGSLGLECTTGREDVAGRARREGRSLEDAARTARHEFFERARVACHADLVAVGHTRDDQAETLLLRLIRGSGPRGLSGMHPRNGAIVRPLLDCGRDELRSWLADRRARGAAAADYVTDETNSDVSIPRNRVRLELLPLLQSKFNPSIVETLADEAALLREVWNWMDEVSAPLLTTPHELDIARCAAPLALQRLVVAGDGSRVRRPSGVLDHVAAVIR